MTSIINESITSTLDDTITNGLDIGPDWDRIPFDVNCSRCGQDLRGRTDPTCPACNLSFDWSDVAPIEQLKCLHCDYHLYGLSETRCPECGEHFSWEAVLADYHRRQKPLFEYHWREHPIRSFFGTLIKTLRPKKFWSKLDIHDPPHTGPLRMMVVATVLIFHLTQIIAEVFNTWFSDVVMTWRYGRGRWNGVTPWLSELPLYLIEALNNNELWSVTLTVTTWLGFSFLSLLIFQQSMKRYKILTSQVVRVWAYTFPVYPLLICFATYLVSYVTIVCGTRYSDWIEVVATLICLVCIMRSLHMGYGVYLRMDHSLGVAIASQVIAVLSTLIILDIVDDRGYGMRIAISLLDLMHYLVH